MLVNGRRPPAEGMLVEPGRDAITVGGRPLGPPGARRYLVLNKPPGTLVTARDERARRTVYDALPTEEAAGLFAVGRLDLQTTGLLLLTDDGDLAQRLAHPRRQVPREYLATVAGRPSAAALERLRRGVDLEDGPTLPAQVELVAAAGDRAQLRLVLREGRNREVRRMLAAVGHPVLALERTAFGPLRLGRLKPGDWRRLRPAELAALRAVVS